MRTVIFDSDSEHEQVVFCQDVRSGLKAIIAVHSTTLGPALGGTRFHPYESEEDALADVLALSRGMAYKSALAGLDLGGGKAVIIGDPAEDKSEALLRAYGAFVASLGGRYITACDVGTFPADMDVVARECAHVTGRSPEFGGAGDSSILTAYGVLQGLFAAAEHRWGNAALYGRRVGVEGVGKVGSRLVGLLVENGATVVVSDVDGAALERVQAAHPGVEAVAGRAELAAADLDVYAPCALGGVLTPAFVEALSATVVCGAANNQLADDGVAKLLHDRGILYAPDYVVNSGGLVQVADELSGFDFARAEARVRGIRDTTSRIFRLAADRAVPPATAADLLAEERMREVGAVRSLRSRLATPVATTGGAR
ncbi:Glu/Leu/Phe/Val dehydrogenase [Amycolatopsis sp. NPDC098790]|uniref:Glu/Leu/Phe/Val family dehydrogenase n=1 Tax=Amycolatopsis sp. NPDC098790 TaxID=3363939 RepID=UPI0038061A5D